MPPRVTRYLSGNARKVNRMTFVSTGKAECVFSAGEIFRCHSEVNECLLYSAACSLQQLSGTLRHPIV